MRNISPGTLDRIHQKTGLQPINFIAITWYDGGPTNYYADRRVQVSNDILLEPRILELGNIENIVKVSDNSRSQSVSVKLDDTDGHLKDIINRTDIHKRNVLVYQWFLDTISYTVPFTDAFIIFQGEINSPIVWKESDRTLSFEIVEKVEDKEIGFSIEEGQFPDFVPEEFIGKPFPLGFGTCVRIPAVQINAPPVGLTRHPIGFADPSINLKVLQNAQKVRNLQQSQWLNSLYAGELAMSAFLMEDAVKHLEQYLNGAINWNEAHKALNNINNSTPISPSFSEQTRNPAGTYQPPGIINTGISDDQKTSGSETGFEDNGEFLDNPDNIDDPEEDGFTPDYTPTVDLSATAPINDFTSSGGSTAQSAIGNTDTSIDTAAIQSAISQLQGQIKTAESQQKSFEKTAAQEAAQAGQIIADNLKLANELTRQLDIGQVTSVINGQKFPRGTLRVKIGNSELVGSFAGDVFNPSGKPVNPEDSRDPNRKPTIDENIEKGKFVVINPGATVKLISDYPIYFIVNLLPSAIHEVLAKRSVNGGQSVLTAVPSSYYRVQQLPFTNISSHTITYNTTIIVLNRGLSTYDEGWEDQIYVTFTSNIGPNTVDILQWLISTYTDHGYDALQFAYARAKVDFCPSHFVLLERKNILTVLEEICFQARLGLWLDNGIFKIKYLSEDVSTLFPVVDTITTDDIEFGSLEIEHSRTEDLVTKFVATYKYFYEDKEPNKIILRYNIQKYDTLEKSYNFYIYNIPACVYQSAVFWLIRKANTWKRIRFKTPLHKLNLETFDTIEVNLTGGDWKVANGAVLGIIESCKYDSASWTIEFEVWIPVRIGEMDPYPLAWTAGVSPYFVFPSNEEITDGSVGVEPNSQTTGKLPDTTAYGGWSSITVDNSPTDTPRLRNQPAGRPRDFGPSNVSDDRNGQEFQIPAVQSATVQNQVAPGIIRVIENPDVPTHQPGEIVNIGTNPAESIKGVKILGSSGLGKITELIMSSPLPNPVSGGATVLKDIERAEAIEEDISDETDYIYRNYDAPPNPAKSPEPIVPTIDSANGLAIPGFITGGGPGSIYAVDMYSNGFNNKPTNIVARQLLIDASATLPVGTPVIVMKIKGNYYINVPVWLSVPT